MSRLDTCRPKLPRPDISRLARLLSASFFLLLMASASWGQIVRGTVTDPDNNPLPGVQITVTSEQASAFRKSLTTDKDGEFVLRFTRNQTQYKFEFLLERTGYQSLKQILSPSATKQTRETFVLEVSETQAMESHGDLSAVLTGSTNAAIEAYNAGLTAQLSRDLPTAKAKLEEALEADPSLGPAHMALSQVLLDQGEHAGALECADKAYELGVSPAEALKVKYQALRALGRSAEADAVAENLEKAEDAVASARRVYNEGGEAFQAGDRAAALQKFQRAAELDPSLQDAHHAVATLLLAEGQHAGAAAAAQNALDLGTDNVDTLRVLYEAYDALGKLDELMEIAPRLAAVDPEFGGAKLVEQAAQLWNAGQSAKAVALSRQALAIDPSLAKGYYFIGLDHLSRGENAKAKASLEKFIQMAPEDGEAATAKEMLTYIE